MLKVIQCRYTTVLFTPSALYINNKELPDSTCAIIIWSAIKEINYFVCLYRTHVSNNCTPK